MYMKKRKMEYYTVVISGFLYVEELCFFFFEVFFCIIYRKHVLLVQLKISWSLLKNGVRYTILSSFVYV